MPAPDALNPRPLPAWPRLRRDVTIIALPLQPLLLAGSGRHVLTVHAPPADLAGWLDGLDGTVSLEQALLAAPLPTEPAQYLLVELSRAGLLIDGNAGRAFAEAEHLQRDALRQAERARDGALPGAGDSRPVAASLAAPTQWRRLLGPALRECREQITLVGPGEARLLVTVATPLQEPPAASAMAAGLPHLLIEVSAFDVLLSPLTLPGRTACPRCWSLHTDAREPDWREWVYRGRAPAAPQMPTHHRALVTAVAVEHTLAAAAVLRGEAQPGLAALERRVDLRSGTVVSAPIRPHPACGCLAVAA